MRLKEEAGFFLPIEVKGCKEATAFTVPTGDVDLFRTYPSNP